MACYRVLVKMFGGSLNPVTGKQEWVLQDRDVSSEEADISKELARSQYGDMLHDRERNHKYYIALVKSIEDLKSRGCEAHVLDIGTGTGLLAMMAARAGATRVTACEVLRPMVRIARQVIARNGFSDIITVVPKRSTEMTEEDMPVRANILVTEVFDTELIGEGALVTFKHAHQHLLEPGCVVIPSSSNLFVRLVDSEFLYSQHQMMPGRIPGGLTLPPSWEGCAGPTSVWDLHVEEIPVPEQMRPLSDSTKIMEFQFDDPNLPTSHFNLDSVPISITDSGRCHGLVVWWDIDLGGSLLTMDPWDYGQWRDHWLQGVFLWPLPLTVSKGEMLNLTFHHDDYSIWFGVEGMSTSVDRPLCTRGVHTACSRTRIGLYNDTARTSSYLSALKKVVPGKRSVCFVSDGCILPLLVARAQAEFPSVTSLYSLESSHHCCRMISELLEANNLSGTIRLLKKPASELTHEDFGVDSSKPFIEAVVGEPFFSSSLLPWHNLHYWYSLAKLRRFMTPECVVLPGVMELKAIAVNFKNMYKLREPVGTVEGFDISEFDRAVGKYTTTVEGVEAEPHHVWEYPSYPRSAIETLMTFDLSSEIHSKGYIRAEGSIILNEPSEPCQGVVLWMDYLLTEGHTISTGLLENPERREKLVWDPNHKQAVYFLIPKYTSRSLVSINYKVIFHSTSGEVSFEFTGTH